MTESWVIQSRVVLVWHNDVVGLRDLSNIGNRDPTDYSNCLTTLEATT
jgi:hypothetical protein